jgi:hypothetical protein
MPEDSRNGKEGRVQSDQEQGKANLTSGEEAPIRDLPPAGRAFYSSTVVSRLNVPIKPGSIQTPGLYVGHANMRL